MSLTKRMYFLYLIFLCFIFWWCVCGVACVMICCFYAFCIFVFLFFVFFSKIAIKVIRNSHRYIEAAKTELRVLQHITNADDGRSCCIHLKDHFHWNKHPVLVFKLYGPSIYTVMAKNHYRPFPDYIVKQLTVQICTAIQCMLLIWLFVGLRSKLSGHCALCGLFCFCFVFCFVFFVFFSFDTFLVWCFWFYCDL